MLGATEVTQTTQTKPALSLREIVDALLSVLEAAADEDGVVNDQAAALLDMLNLSLEQKVEARAQVHLRLKADEQVNREMAAHYESRARVLANQAESLRTSTQQEMERAGIAKVKTPTASAGIQANAPSLELLCDESAVPNEWVELVPKLKRAELVAALKGGAEFKFAKLHTGTHLRFR